MMKNSIKLLYCLAGAAFIMTLHSCNERAKDPEKTIASSENTNDVSDLLALVNEKDSTSVAVMQSTAAINQVYDRLLFLSSKRSTSKSTVRETGSMLKMLDSLNNIVKTGKERLSNIDARLMSLQNKNTLVTQVLPKVKQNIAEINNNVEIQENGIISLKERVGNFKKITERRLVEIARQRAEQAKVANNADDQSVYYIIGTEKELLGKKIVQESGGTNLGIFGKLGVTLTPSKELHQSEFHKFYPQKDNKILLDSLTAKAGKDNKPKHFKVVSAHNEKYIEPVTDSTKTIRSFKISNESKFWKPSPYLIIVVDENE